MRFGLCTAPENVELAGRLGFDYVELAAAAVAALGEEEFAALKTRVDGSRLRAERFNVLFPGDFRLLGPESSVARTRRYVDALFPRLKALGGRVVVFGSGRARAFPPGLSLKEGFQHLLGVTRLLGEAAAAHDLVIAIEPLNREETNAITTVVEGALLQAAVDSPAVGLLADLYHLLKEREPLEDILLARDLTHTHIALLKGRAFPVQADHDVTAFFTVLKKAGYDGAMSIEGNAADLEHDAGAALAVLRSQATAN